MRLFDRAVPTVKEVAYPSFQFQPGQYPVRQCYQGSYEFSMHYYPSISDLHKGEPYKTNDDSREKNQVGEQWEKSSGGCDLFLFAVAKDEAGRSVYQQLADKLT